LKPIRKHKKGYYYNLYLPRCYKRVILFLLSLALIGGILYYVGFEDTIGVMLSIPPSCFVFLLLLQLFTMFMSAVKWRVVLRRFRVSFRNLLAATFVGYFINNVTPIGIAGGEPVKAYLLSKKEKIPSEAVFSSVVVDLFLEIIPIFLLSAIAIFLIVSKGISLEIAVVIFAASLALMFLFTLSLTLAVNKEYSMKIIDAVLGVLSKIPYIRGKTGKYILKQAACMRSLTRR